MQKVIGWVVAVAIAAGLVFGMKFWNKGSDGREVHDGMQAIVRQLPCYASNAAYVDSVFEAAHTDAFDQCYTMGGRRRAATFNQQQYVAILFSGMRDRARADGQIEIAKEFDAARTSVAMAVAEAGAK